MSVSLSYKPKGALPLLRLKLLPMRLKGTEKGGMLVCPPVSFFSHYCSYFGPPGGRVVERVVLVAVGCGEGEEGALVEHGGQLAPLLHHLCVGGGGMTERHSLSMGVACAAAPSSVCSGGGA